MDQHEARHCGRTRARARSSASFTEARARSFQHFCHHAKSIANVPYHTGFFFKVWDNRMGSVYPEERCFCSKCARAKGERTREAWDALKKPDYTPLLSPRFWLLGAKDSTEGKTH